MDGSDHKCAHLLDLAHVGQTESGSSEQLGSAGVNGSFASDGTSAIDRAEKTDGGKLVGVEACIKFINYLAIGP
jgi:hypothetical protein